ncbi:YqiA/YcfP family alpha/beta fold hydrolase [Marinimicrobium sp. ABcell2]|uniref:YqiA/YcfP family alpha/beta fold hydrolase n=1 Tax=Marinimicrobium sp. ABcell2 TaxID=3069751 RepID=UPI0027B72703|nr:YqiA/YcfP family alpha/beta fold hydrolase [Marinimicrobium sp. ABcell2]MDQ2076450.1 YqiA/YcfP family alpha/beta fold hydrolase [Marinimicrobium sp. ABcell2]
MAVLIYLHGFLSSPRSHKARQVADWLARERPDITYVCPHLTPYPDRTRQQLETLVNGLSGERIYLMGSSLGGFWATWLSERYDLRTVLINPSVRPWDFMPDYLEVDLKGYHTDDSYRLEARHLAQIKAMDVPRPSRPENYWLLVQTGDETLDYRQAVEKYRGARQTVEPGGDHAFQGLERHLPELIAFLDNKD